MVDRRPLLAQDHLRAPVLQGGQQHLDCLVVGAGPVGLLLASELAFRGCSVRVIDSLTEPNPHTKASLIQARSLEVLPAEVTDKIIKGGHRIGNITVREARPGNPTAEAVMNLDTEPIEGYHMMFSEKQWETERYLTEYLTSLPDHRKGDGSHMKVERGIELMSFSENATGVEASLRNAKTGTVESVTAKFLVGCDGGHSKVRKSLGFLFDGEANSEYFFALDAALDGAVFDPNSLDVVCSSGSDPMAPGMAFSVPFKDGTFLVVLDLDQEQQAKYKTGELDSYNLPILRQPQPEDVQSLLRKRGCGQHLHVLPGSVKWIAHFRLNSRQAEHYGRSRVYLAGDACHCHSPLGGQGMNMGFQDAKNLAWKLALVIKGVGPPLLLTSYEAERKDLEKKLLRAITMGQAAVSKRHPLAYFLSGRGQRLISFFDGVRTSALKFASQQGWTYRGSALSAEHWERPVPTLCPITSICPAGGYRRRQNLHRWLASRVHAGDRVPNVRVPVGGTNDMPAKTLHQVLKRSRGWTLLLFEGCRRDNEDMKRHVKGCEILDVEGLHRLGESLRSRPDASGFVSTIDEVVVFQAADEAHSTFGVHGQCLFLVRPDHYVGFRTEPVRRGAVCRYFRQALGINHGQPEDAPASSPSFDWLPTAVWTLLVLGAGCLAYSYVIGR